MRSGVISGPSRSAVARREPRRFRGRAETPAPARRPGGARGPRSPRRRRLRPLRRPASRRTPAHCRRRTCPSRGLSPPGWAAAARADHVALGTDHIFLRRSPAFWSLLAPLLVVSAHPLFTRWPGTQLHLSRQGPFANPMSALPGARFMGPRSTRDFTGLPTTIRSVGSYQPSRLLLATALACPKRPFFHHITTSSFHAINGAILQALHVLVNETARDEGDARGFLFVACAIIARAVSGIVRIADVLGRMGCCCSRSRRSRCRPGPCRSRSSRRSSLACFARRALGVCTAHCPSAALLLLIPLTHPTARRGAHSCSPPPSPRSALPISPRQAAQALVPLAPPRRTAAEPRWAGPLQAPCPRFPGLVSPRRRSRGSSQQPRWLGRREACVSPARSASTGAGSADRVSETGGTSRRHRRTDTDLTGSGEKLRDPRRRRDGGAPSLAAVRPLAHHLLVRATALSRPRRALLKGNRRAPGRWKRLSPISPPRSRVPSEWITPRIAPTQ
jgi:hypothetical protein